MLGWFETNEVDAFAQEVISELVKRLPPTSLEAPDHKTGDRVHRMTEALSGRVREFARARKPNLFKRARLGNRVKWGMREAGYAEEFVAAFTGEFLILITVASRG